MKKDDVVDYIAAILEEETDLKWLDMSYNQVALKILNRLEYIGMQPPYMVDPVLFRKERKWDR